MRAAKVSTSSTTLHLPKDGLCEHKQCFKLTGRAPRHLRFDGFNPGDLNTTTSRPGSRLSRSTCFMISWLVSLQTQQHRVGNKWGQEKKWDKSPKFMPYQSTPKWWSRQAVAPRISQNEILVSMRSQVGPILDPSGRQMYGTWGLGLSKTAVMDS